MTGQSIKNVLENQLKNQDKTVLQISGGKLYYKRQMNKTWILDNFQVPCGSNYCDIEDTKVYSVSLTAYLSNGGGGWTFPKKHFVQKSWSASLCILTKIHPKSAKNQSKIGKSN